MAQTGKGAKRIRTESGVTMSRKSDRPVVSVLAYPDQLTHWHQSCNFCIGHLFIRVKCMRSGKRRVDVRLK